MITSAILQAAQVAAGVILLKPKRGLYGLKLADGTELPDIIAQATIEESHHDRMEITSHPVEQGAAISDHAFAYPSEVTLRLGWSNSKTPTAAMALASAAVGFGAVTGGAAGGIAAATAGVGMAAYNLLSVTGESEVTDAYNALLYIYYNRVLFTLWTGKAYYKNMICRGIHTETDYTSDNALIVVVECQEIIMVSTQMVTLEQSKQADASSTATPSQRGTQMAKLV